MPWPPSHLVAECSTRSAPNSNGRQRQGVAKVLSIRSGRPASCATSATLAMSRTSSPGLPIVSPNRSRVSGRIAAAKARRIARVDEARLDPEARQGELQKVGRAAVERLGRDDVAARPHQRHDREVERRLAACGRDRADPALECRDPLLEHRRGRVRDPRIDVPGALEIEQGRRLIGVGEHVGRRLIDRHRARPGRRVRPLAGVQGKRVELQKLGLGHRLGLGHLGPRLLIQAVTPPPDGPDGRARGRGRSGRTCADRRSWRRAPPPRARQSAGRT